MPKRKGMSAAWMAKIRAMRGTGKRRHKIRKSRVDSFLLNKYT
jgi:hypothetical protein